MWGRNTFSVAHARSNPTHTQLFKNSLIKPIRFATTMTTTTTTLALERYINLRTSPLVLSTASRIRLVGGRKFVFMANQLAASRELFARALDPHCQKCTQINMLFSTYITLHTHFMRCEIRYMKIKWMRVGMRSYWRSGGVDSNVYREEWKSGTDERTFVRCKRSSEIRLFIWTAENICFKFFLYL